MLRNGVDLLDISRLARMQYEQPAIFERFLKRVYTKKERDESHGRLSYLAGRFAGKEAAAKAFLCGIGSLGWQSIEILQGEMGQPVLVFHERASRLVEELKITQWSISISHTDELAIAMVVMQ
ncbi:MAG: holo-ACP synthase [Anaerolineaceae bacterium]|nr:holo-ACP synthase [Anaerolineaceae bacterium]